MIKIALLITIGIIVCIKIYTNHINKKNEQELKSFKELLILSNNHIMCLYDVIATIKQELYLANQSKEEEKIQINNELIEWICKLETVGKNGIYK